MKYRAAIFDLDGTLVDTLEDLAISVNEMLASYGFPTHPLDEYRYYLGNGSRSSSSARCRRRRPPMRPLSSRR